MKTITMDWETYQEELELARFRGSIPAQGLIRLLQTILANVETNERLLLTAKIDEHVLDMVKKQVEAWEANQ